MNRTEIIEKLEKIFQEVFSDETIVLHNELTANDLDQWTSLTHMILISEIESYFSIKFKLKDLKNMQNVGALIELVGSKLREE